MSTFSQFSIEKASPWYLTGLVESAGSFTFSRSGAQLLLAFAVRCDAANRPLLESVRRFLGAGRIYDSKGGSYFRINRPQELLQVVHHFDRHPLQGGKRKAYRIWREMVFLKLSHHGSEPPERLRRLAEELTRCKKTSRRPGEPGGRG